MADNVLLWSLVSICVYGASGEYCYEGDDYTSRKIYCSGDCCGSKYNRYCCNDIATDRPAISSATSNISSAMNGAVIVGIIIGCLILVSIIVSVIVCVFCCLRKSRASTGHVVGQGGATATVVTNTTPYQTAYPQPAYYPGQPAYNPGQPAYNPGQPAYNPDQQAYNPGQQAYNAGQPAYNPSQPAYNPGQAAHSGGQQAYNQTPVYPTSPADQPPPYQS